ncbi:MAG: TIGR03663 family protein [Deltaproteobacteria bacterium]|nr:TIGR03663 family protein [Deltaproteobacteria bacterium]
MTPWRPAWPRSPYFWAWAGLLALAAVARLWGLDDAVLSYDESLHAYYGYIFFRTGSYTHTPVTHGPLLFHVAWVFFKLFGDSDFTARLPVALAGVALAASPLLFLRQLGRRGAWWAGLLLALGPTFLFYSRYIRNDIYISLIFMVLLRLTLGYLARPRPGWLVALAGGLGLAFACKENSFLFGGFLGFYLAVTALWRAWRWAEPLRQSPPAQVAVLLLTLVLPFLTSLGHLALGWDPMDLAHPAALLHSEILLAAFGLVSLALAWGWTGGWSWGGGQPATFRFRTWLAAAAVFWAVVLTLYSTVFSHFPEGVISGVVGSVGYWLQQHGVERGNQPWFYYSLLVVIYEYFVLLGSLAGGAWVLARRLRQPGVPGRGAELDFPLFLLAWVAASWLTYNVAGEKMPWLVMHLALPMALLTAWGLGRLMDTLDWNAARWRGGWLLLAAGEALPLCLGLALLAPEGHGRGDFWVLWPWLVLALLGGLAVVAVIWKLPRLGWGQGLRLLALGVAAVLLALYLRTSFQLSHVNNLTTKEMLVYAHGAQDVAAMFLEIAEANHAAGGSPRVATVCPDFTVWPLFWYLRRFSQPAFPKDPTNPQLKTYPAVLACGEPAVKLADFLGEPFLLRPGTLIWWPPMGYTHLTWAEVGEWLSQRERRQRLWAYFWDRVYPGPARDGRPLVRTVQLSLRKNLLPPVVLPAGTGP